MTITPSSTPPQQGTVSLVPQTGMPPVYQKRSRELIYDVLQQNARFIKNPYGPQILVLSRSNHCW
jgi:hypothetical protein